MSPESSPICIRPAEETGCAYACLRQNYTLVEKSMGFPVLSPSSFTVFSDQQLECHCADVQGTSTEEGQMRGSVGTNGTAVLATWHEGDTMATIQVQATVGLLF